MAGGILEIVEGLEAVEILDALCLVVAEALSLSTAEEVLIGAG